MIQNYNSAPNESLILEAERMGDLVDVYDDMLQVLKLPGVGSLSSIDVDTVRGIIYVADHDHHRVHAVAVRGAENYTSTLPSSSPQAGANAGLNPGGRKQKPKQRNINRRKKRTGRGGA